MSIKFSSLMINSTDFFLADFSSIHSMYVLLTEEY